MGASVVSKPPWHDAPDAAHWVPISRAAEIFRKSIETIRIYAKDGTLPAWHDGFKWWVKLDFPDQSSSNSQISPK